MPGSSGANRKQGPFPVFLFSKIESNNLSRQGAVKLPVVV